MARSLHVVGDVTKFAVQLLAGSAQSVEGLRLGAHLARHQNAHGDTDLAVTLHCTFEVEDFLLVHDVEQRERGVRGKDRGERDSLCFEGLGFRRVEVQSTLSVASKKQAKAEHATYACH